MCSIVPSREEEKSYSSIDRKYTVKDLPSSSSSASQTNPNRTTTPANPWAEPDNNFNSSSQHSTSSSSAVEKNHAATTPGKSATGGGDPEEQDVEMEAAAHLLTKQEKSLCLQLDLKPTQYLTQKTLLLQVSLFLDIRVIHPFAHVHANLYARELCGCRSI